MAKKQNKSSYAELIERFNKIAKNYVGLPTDSITSAFARAGNMADMAIIQNSRVKEISSLPANFTKQQIAEMLRNPYGNEQQLRQTSEILRYTAYPYFKITKTYADIPTYKHYISPLYVDETDVKNKEFLREAKLLDKLEKNLCIEQAAHKIVGQAVTQGKVFYSLRGSVDKAHNKINYTLWQQLPEDWCYIIGYNNISKYTVSFDLMYFMQIGTDWRQFGDLFEPYLDDFNELFIPPKNKKQIAFSSVPKIQCKGKKMPLYVENYNKNAKGNPKLFQQNGQWFYYVSLPIDKVWTFEIDDTTPTVAPALSGLMLTYSQQSNFEEVQYSLLTNPLIKIFTGEIPYFNDDGTMVEDSYKLSAGGRMLFETLFNNLMSQNNTGGTGLFAAPLQNIRSHDYPESANANQISESFNRYSMEKAGLSSIIPSSDDVKASQVASSELIESRYVTSVIYPQLERMINTFIKSLNLNYEWNFKMLGTIFTEDEIRETAYRGIANGDISQHFVLCALDGVSWIDKLAMMTTIKSTGILDMLIPPITSYTMKQDTNGGLPPQNGRPKEKGVETETKEKSIDVGVTDE